MTDKHHDNGTCLHCGGRVGEDGYAESDEKEGDAIGPRNPEEVDDSSPQFELNKRMRHAALAKALKGAK